MSETEHREQDAADETQHREQDASEESRDPERLADELDGQADHMARDSERLGNEIGEARQDWERKRSDPAVPGAPPRTEESDRDAPGDDVNPEDAGR